MGIPSGKDPKGPERNDFVFPEPLEELRSEKSRLLQSLDYAEDTNEEAIRKDISAMESMLENLSRQKQKYAAELDSALKEHAALEEQAAEVDPGELMAQCLAIRTEKEQSAVARVRSACGEQYQPLSCPTRNGMLRKCLVRKQRESLSESNSKRSSLSIKHRGPKSGNGMSGKDKALCGGSFMCSCHSHF